MRKLLFSIGVIAAIVCGLYARAVQADYAVRMDLPMVMNDDRPIMMWRNYVNSFGAVWGSAERCYTVGQALECSITYSADYRDNSSSFVLSIIPQNIVFPNCFTTGSAWQIDIVDRHNNDKVLDSYTHRHAAGVPVEWGASYFIPASKLAGARLSAVIGGDVRTKVITRITSKGSGRSPLRAECLKSVTWQMILPDWTYEWLGHYGYVDCKVGCFGPYWVQ